MRRGQILAFALAFFMLPALSVITSAQEAAPAVEIDCAPDPVMNVHPSYYEDVELLCIVSNPSSFPETISVEKEWDANNIEMILSEDSFEIEAGEEEEFTITFSGPTKLSADTSYSFTLNAQVDTWGGIVPVPVDQFNFNASYEGDFTVSTYGMVELEMSDKSVRTLELDEQRIISFQFSNYGNDEDKIRVSIANEAELLESGFSFPLGTFVAEDVASGGVSSIRDLTVSAPSVVTKEIRVQMVIRAESTNDDSAEFSEIVITLLVEKPSEISGLGGLDEMSTGDMKKYGAIIGAGILGVFILVLALKVVGRRSSEGATVRTIELPEIEEATKPDIDDLDEFDDMFDDLIDEEDDLDSFLNDL